MAGPELKKVKLPPLFSDDFEVRKPRILCWDIETAPIMGAVWRYYETNVVWIEQDWYMLGWSAKWLGGEQITRMLPDYKGYKPGVPDDRALVTELHELIQQADILVAHNGDAFDIKKSKARFVKNGLPPISPQTYCTKKMCKRNFGFTSNKLDEVAKFLDIGQKLQTDKSLWQGCIAGDKASWAKMAKYCARDTRLLEKVYLALRSWDRQHPNLNVLMNRVNGCSKCGGTDIKRRGYRYSPTGRAVRYQCKRCLGYSTGKHTKTSEIR
jgi:DNA polymerase III epsilon subunit-like protein